MNGLHRTHVAHSVRITVIYRPYLFWNLVLHVLQFPLCGFCTFSVTISFKTTCPHIAISKTCPNFIANLIRKYSVYPICLEYLWLVIFVLVRNCVMLSVKVYYLTDPWLLLLEDSQSNRRLWGAFEHWRSVNHNFIICRSLSVSLIKIWNKKCDLYMCLPKFS